MAFPDHVRRSSTLPRCCIRRAVHDPNHEAHLQHPVDR